MKAAILAIVLAACAALWPLGPALAQTVTPTDPNTLPVPIRVGGRLLLGGTRSAVEFALGKPDADETDKPCEHPDDVQYCRIAAASWHDQTVEADFFVQADRKARASDRVAGYQMSFDPFHAPTNAVATDFAKTFLPNDATELAPMTDLTGANGVDTFTYGAVYHSDVVARELPDPICNTNLMGTDFAKTYDPGTIWVVVLGTADGTAAGVQIQLAYGSYTGDFPPAP